MATLPPEIWQEIFSFACTDTGSTGRSLSLVSKDFHDISSPFKYQSIAITRLGQLFAFSQTFSQLPDVEKKIRYLFIHCPYPFIDVEDNSSIADERFCLEIFTEDPVSPGVIFVPDGEESDSDPDYSDTESHSDSGSDSDSDSDESLDSEEQREVLEDAKYLYAVYEGVLPAEGNTREDEADDDIQPVFDQAIQALHAILNETSETLKILTLYWTSFRPLPVHYILPPLPFLDELHLFRCSVVAGAVHDDSPTTPLLFPRLRLLFMSGDRYHHSISSSVPKIAPNLTHFRFTRESYICDIGPDFIGPRTELTLIEKQALVMRRPWIGDLVIETSSEWATDQIKTLVEGTIDKPELLRPVMGYLGEIPETWLCLWSSRVAGRPEAWSVRRSDLSISL